MAANQKIYESPDGHICECCHPTAYIGPQGELYAMWRNWVSGSRDMYYAVSGRSKDLVRGEATRRKDLAVERVSRWTAGALL